MVTANDYWHNHYVFEKHSPLPGKNAGIGYVQQYYYQQHHPLLYTYGKMIPDQAILKKSIRWLEQMPAEQNH